MKLFGKKFIYAVFANLILFFSSGLATINFANQKSKIILKNGNASIKFNPTTVRGWRDSSLVNRYSGIGLGDYNLKQYDYNLDNVITYSNLSNGMQTVDWNIQANETVHIKENIYMDGYNGTINLANSAQIFVDDNVTLTLRNVTIASVRNGAGNPPIKLATTRSQLALDNVKIDMADDFYFDRGQLFAYNDVNFAGTNAFIYRSCQPSYIKSGANLKFNQGTTFDFRPSTTGTPSLLAKDLLFMDDATSKITFDGASLKTTLTGLRLKIGQVLFDNNVSVSSQTQFALKNLGTWITQTYGTTVQSVNLSPDGRYLAVGGSSPTSGNELQIYSFTGSAMALVTSQDYGTNVYSVNWSPDGRYLAVGGRSPTSGNELEVYSFTGSALSLVASQDYGTYVFSVNWSPDGKYLAVGGYQPTSGNEIQVYRFTGSTMALVTSQDYGTTVYSVNWSPDGRYLAVGGQVPTSGNELQVYSFTGSALSLVASQDYGTYAYSVNWSPDGRYLAVGGQFPSSGNEIQVYRFTGLGLSLVASQDYGSVVLSMNWSPDGRYLAVGGSSPTSENEIQVYSFTGSALSLIASQNYGSTAYSVNWSPDGRYLAVGGQTPAAGHDEIEIYTLYYGPETQTQALTNSIVFGNSAAGSLSDVNVKLLSGANVSLDGMLNYDNINSTSIFNNDNSRFVLKDWKSKIRVGASTLVGWRDSSIVQSVSGFGLGDCNFRLYSNSFDGIITYSISANSLQYSNWDIPANTAVHVSENIYMDGYGGTINLANSSQIFVDDNVTLTLRNVTINSVRNGVGNPPIKLATTRSQLALDNVKISMADDFYFDRGQLFAYNDVNFTGTNAFVYRSTQPSYIKSGANLKFNPGTTFDFRPSTTGTPSLLAKDLLFMDDATSKITFDGASLKTTLTGMRLATGQVLFDNNVSVSSQSQFALKNLGTWITQNYGTTAHSVNWSPDGRYLAVGGSVPTSGNEIQVYSFSGSGLSPVASHDYGTHVFSVSWSPDGRYLAVGGQVPTSGNEIQVYSFTGSALSLVASHDYGNYASGAYVYSLNWSPDGKYLAMCGTAPTSGNEIQVYRFTGSGLSLVASQNYGTQAFPVSWSPDGRYLAVGGYQPTSGNEIQVYSFTGSALSLVASQDYGTAVYSVNWSPDGRYLAVGGSTPASGNEIQVYRFTSSGLSLVASQDYGSVVLSMNWSPDGRYLAVCGQVPTSGDEIQLYRFTGSALSLIASQNYGSTAYSVNWSPDGKYLALGGQTPAVGHDEIEVYTLYYGPETQTQAVSNSIVFGNSSLQPQSLSTKFTSTHDVTVKLLSGANVLVDGILNIDNSATNTNSVIFANDNARFVLKDWKSKIRSNLNSMQGWRDSSIVQNVSGIGLGDYNLKQYDYVPDNTLTYSEVSNSMQYMDWNIPANTIVHINENIYMDGYGGTIKLGENAELFVDDNVTLTLRNVAIISAKNGMGNPAIKLATGRSKLALDNASLNCANDFYFNCGSLFVHNDVRFTGTSAFVYNSCQPSFITSGARLIFDTSTTFSFAPNTFTSCPYTVVSTYTANDFIKMADRTSKLIFNGCDVYTTLTGMRLTTGEVVFDNKINLESKMTNTIAGIPATSLGTGAAGTNTRGAYWSPDGRFLVVTNLGSASIQIFRFSASGAPTLIGSASTGLSPNYANWSPDGKYLAVTSANGVEIFRFSGSGNPVLVNSTSVGYTPISAIWSPDGQFVSVVGSGLLIFRFQGGDRLVLLGSASAGTAYLSDWSPDGKFIATPDQSTDTLKIFRFSGSGDPVLVGTVATDDTPYSVDWSADGRFLAVINRVGLTLQIFRFTGSGNPALVGSIGVTGAPRPVAWSPDGRYVATAGRTEDRLKIYGFNGSGNPVLIGRATTGTDPWALNWSPDGKYIAVANDTASTVQVFAINFINNTQTQATSNSIVLGNSSLGSSSDVALKLLSGANVSVSGTLNYDNVLGGTIFSADNSRFVVKDSNSKIRVNPTTVTGWKDRSLIKNQTGVGQGDYNLQTYASGRIVSFTSAAEELVYSNSNAINYWGPFSRGTSNTVNYYGVKARTDSNSFSYRIKNDSNAIVLFSTLGNANSNAVMYLSALTRANSNTEIWLTSYIPNTVKIYSTQQIYSTHTTVDAFAWYKSGFEVYPGKIFALKTPLPVSGQISLAGSLTLSSDLFLDSSVTWSSIYGSGRIIGNDKSIHLTTTLVIPDGHFMRVGGNLVIEGYGNTILLGNSAELFVDDNVTLTLRNITISSSKNGAGNPAIKLASTRSQLALDNVKFDMADDFYFDTGSLFVYNDVNFSGTNAFIYRSTVPSYIKSGANLKFNSGTIFDYRPSTTGTPSLLAKDLLIFDDANSKLTFDGSTLKTTLTGMRLATGQVLFDNKVSLTSQSQFALKSLGTWIYQNYGTQIFSVNWSPDGRYLAVGGQSPTSTYEIQVYRFNGSELSLVASQDYGTTVSSVNWSPDGIYLAVGGQYPTFGNEIQVYRFTGSALSLVASQDYGNWACSVIWSPDGRYLAVGGNVPTSGNEIQVYRFTGSALSLVASQDYGTTAYSVNWSPDGRYLAVGGQSPTSGNEIQVYSFTGSALSLVASQDYGNSVRSVNWSPDGRYLAIGGETPTSGNDIQVYRFTGSALSLVDSLPYESYVDSVNWSVDGRYLAVGGHISTDENALQVYKFTGSALSLVDSLSYGLFVHSVNWSVDGRYLAVGGYNPDAGHDELEVYTLYYGPETQIQAASNSIVFGNSALGSASDVTLKLLSGANILVDGILNYDNVLGATIFSAVNSRFVLKDSDSKIRMQPGTVVGWSERSLIKNQTGVGLGDYNLQSYAGGDKVVTFAEAPGDLLYTSSSTINNFAGNFISVNSAKYYIINGISGNTTLNGRSMLASPIDLQGGTLTLNGDMILSSQTTIPSSGNFDLNGYAMILGGDLSIPSNVGIKVASSGIIDGQGNNFEIQNLGKLSVDNDVTLTLKNINLLGHGSWPIEMRTGSSTLALDNVITMFDRDFTFSQGKLFIHDEVVVTGTNKFSYASTATAYVTSHAMLCFDKNTTFSYSPRLTGRHTLSERNLIKLADKSSGIYFDNCTLQLPDAGWRLTAGTIYFDGRVTVNAQSTQAQSFEWGDGTAVGDVDVALLSGASVDANGYVYHNASN